MALADNLIAYWTLDEASGNAIDAHGSNDLTETSGTIDAASGKVGGARDFEAGDTEWFEIADNTDLSTGDIDFTFACWVRAETLASFPCIAQKGWSGLASADREWVLYYNTTSSRFVMEKGAGTAAVSVTASNFGAASTATGYFVVIYHDSVNDIIGISVNAGTPNTTSTSTGVNNGNRAFVLGASTVGQSLYWDGVIDEAGFWKRVLTSDERTELYNIGNGRDYAYIIGGGGGGITSPLTRSKLLTSPLIGGRLVF